MDAMVSIWRRMLIGVALVGMLAVCPLGAQETATPAVKPKWVAYLPLPQPTLTYSMGLTHDSFSWRLPAGADAEIVRLRSAIDSETKAGRPLAAARAGWFLAKLLNHFRRDRPAVREAQTAALAAVDAALRKNASDTAALLLKAEVLLALKRPQAAIDSTDLAAKGNPRCWAVLALGMRARTRLVVDPAFWRQLADESDVEKARRRLRKLLISIILWRNDIETRFADALKAADSPNVAFCWSYYQFSLAANSLASIHSAARLIFRGSTFGSDGRLVLGLRESVLDAKEHVRLLTRAVATGKATFQMRAHLATLRLLRDVYDEVRRGASTLGIGVDNPVTLYLLLYKMADKDRLEAHLKALKTLEREAPGKYWELPLLKAGVQLSLGRWAESQRTFVAAAARCPRFKKPVQGALLVAFVRSQHELRGAREQRILARVAVKRLRRELGDRSDQDAKTQLRKAEAALLAADAKHKAVVAAHENPLANPYLDEIAETVVKLIGPRLQIRTDEESVLWLAFLQSRLGRTAEAAEAYETLDKASDPKGRFIGRYGKTVLRIKAAGEASEADLAALREMSGNVPRTQQAVTQGMIRAAIAVAQLLRNDRKSAEQTVKGALDYLDPTGAVEKLSQLLGVSGKRAKGDMNLVLNTVGFNRDAVVAVLVEAGLSRERVAECVRTAPCTAKRNMSRQQAEDLKKKLERVGATVELY